MLRLAVGVPSLAAMLASSVRSSFGRGGIRHAGSLQQLSSTNGIVDHGFVGRLLLQFNGQHRILSNLGGRVSCGVGLLQRHERIPRRRFLQRLALGPLEQAIDAPFAEKVGLRLFGRARLSVRRAIVHPVHSIDLLLTTGRLLHLLKFLDLTLLLTLLDHLVDPLALVERLPFFLPYSPLIADQRRMEGLFQIEILIRLSAKLSCAMEMGDPPTPPIVPKSPCRLDLDDGQRS